MSIIKFVVGGNMGENNIQVTVHDSSCVTDNCSAQLNLPANNFLHTEIEKKLPAKELLHDDANKKLHGDSVELISTANNFLHTQSENVPAKELLHDDANKILHDGDSTMDKIFYEKNAKNDLPANTLLHSEIFFQISMSLKLMKKKLI